MTELLHVLFLICCDVWCSLSVVLKAEIKTWVCFVFCFLFFFSSVSLSVTPPTHSCVWEEEVRKGRGAWWKHSVDPDPERRDDKQQQQQQLSAWMRLLQPSPTFISLYLNRLDVFRLCFYFFAFTPKSCGELSGGVWGFQPDCLHCNRAPLCFCCWRRRGKNKATESLCGGNHGDPGQHWAVSSLGQEPQRAVRGRRNRLCAQHHSKWSISWGVNDRSGVWL